METRVNKIVPHEDMEMEVHVSNFLMSLIALPGSQCDCFY